MIPEKYGITETAYKNMIKDGIISCSWPRFEEVYKTFKRNQADNPHGALMRTAEQMNMAPSTVSDIIKRFP